jgi:hypothetical protein
MNSILKWIAFALVIVSLSSGCRTFTNPARVKQFNAAHTTNVVWMDFDGTRRVGLLIPTNSHFRVVLEPAPDATIETTAKFVASFAMTNQLSADQTTRITEKITQLGEVTAIVKALRESLFRINELSVNGHLDKIQVERLYTNALHAVVALADKSANDAKKAAAEAETAQVKAIQSLAVSQEEKALLLQNLTSPKE